MAWEDDKVKGVEHLSLSDLHVQLEKVLEVERDIRREETGLTNRKNELFKKKEALKAELKKRVNRILSE